MRTAAPATGRANRALGKSVAKNRPAPPVTSAVRAPRAFPRSPAAPAVQCNWMSQCYIHVSSTTNHPKINRQPRRLEFIVSRTKQTPATPINRQLLRTLQITNRSLRNTSRPQIGTALLDTNGRFRPNNKSRNSFKTNDRANSYSIQTATPAPARHSSQVTGHSLSNRQWQILEFNVNHTIQTTAPHSNRHFFAISASRMRAQECGSREPGNAILLNGDLLQRHRETAVPGSRASRQRDYSQQAPIVVMIG